MRRCLCPLVGVVILFSACGSRSPAQLAGDGLPRDGSGSDRVPVHRFVEVAAGGNGTCAILDDANMVCWGDPTGDQARLPEGGLFTSVALNYSRGCAIRQTGQLTCWGMSGSGDPSVPPGIFAAVAVGAAASCALRANGLAACWGSPDPEPIEVPDTRMVSLSAAGRNVCGLSQQQGAACWSLAPRVHKSPSSPSIPLLAVAANGFWGACGIRKSDSGVVCWDDSATETWVELPGERFEQIGLGYLYGCALKADGTIRCWGGGQLDPSDPPPSRAQPPPGADYVKLSVGSGHSCAIRRDGRIDCWGDNRYGQLEAPSPNSIP